MLYGKNIVFMGVLRDLDGKDKVIKRVSIGKDVRYEKCRIIWVFGYSGLERYGMVLGW